MFQIILNDSDSLYEDINSIFVSSVQWTPNFYQCLNWVQVSYCFNMVTTKRRTFQEVQKMEVRMTVRAKGRHVLQNPGRLPMFATHCRSLCGKCSRTLFQPSRFRVISMFGDLKRALKGKPFTSMLCYLPASSKDQPRFKQPDSSSIVVIFWAWQIDMSWDLSMGVWIHIYYPVKVQVQLPELDDSRH